MIDGYSSEHPVKGVHLYNCVFEGVADGNDIEFATDLTLDNVLINGQPAEAAAPEQQ